MIKYYAYVYIVAKADSVFLLLIVNIWIYLIAISREVKNTHLLSRYATGSSAVLSWMPENKIYVKVFQFQNVI